MATDPRPLPAVLLVHDTLGLDLRSLPYVEQLAAAGLLVLEIAPEPDEPAIDAVRRGMAALRAHPRVDAARIGLLGFGAGGRAAVLATEGTDTFAARVLLYPGCAALLRDLPMATAAPRGGLLLLHGAEDRANAEPDCAALALRLAGGLATRRVTYRGATYGWDFPSAEPLAPWLYPAPGDDVRVRIRPWPALTAFSASEAASFLAAALRHGDL
jgi:dienelactone hydrolase